jgi:hypothetical protein
MQKAPGKRSGQKAAKNWQGKKAKERKRNETKCSCPSALPASRGLWVKPELQEKKKTKERERKRRLG